MNYRDDFPILKKVVNGHPIVYFDNAATSQKPLCVIEEINNFYLKYNSNVHRGVHELSQKATNLYENSRNIIQQFIGAEEREEIILTKGTTDAINIVAYAWAYRQLIAGDQILITAMEHHSNIVPWQMISELTGCRLIVAPIDSQGQIIMEEMKRLITSKTKLISLTHVSNTLGTINPVEEIIELGRLNGSKILLDAAQSVPHMSLDVKKLKCDFLAFSGHKVFGPTGIGVLYVKKEIFNEMTPFIGGGDMIKEVTFEKTIYNDPPQSYEAGTPNIVGAIGLAKALEYILQIGLDQIQKVEKELLDYATCELQKISGVNIIGTAYKKASVISFLIDGSHPFDIGTILDQLGIAIRTGHHCTQPLMDFYKIAGTARVSFAFYNTIEEVDYFINAIKKCKKMLC